MFMPSALARRLAVHPPGIDPALWRFAGECNGFFARLMGYMGALALIAIVLVGLWGQLQMKAGAMVASEPGASARYLPDSPDKPAGYNVRRPDYEWSRQVSLLGLRGGL